MYRLVLFDVDETLLDTAEFIYQAYEHTLRTHRLSITPRDQMATAMGKTH